MFCELELFSSSIGRMTHVCVILPEPVKSTEGLIGMNTGLNPGTNGLKTLYLLHGLSDDNTVWHRRTSIERYATEKGLAVIMPDGGRSWYTDEKYGYKYYQYVAHELPRMMEYTFPLSTDPKDRYIGGLSMGGYGAMKIGLREQGQFSKIISLSGVLDMEQYLQFEKKIGEEGGYPSVGLSYAFGDDYTVSDVDNTIYLANNYKQMLRPDMFIACGTEDALIDSNRYFVDKVQSLGFNVKYIENKGCHNWEFWDKHILMALDWLFK